MRDVVTNSIIASCGTAGVFILLRGFAGATQILNEEQCPFAASVVRDEVSGVLMANCGDRIVTITKFPVINLTPINTDTFPYSVTLVADRINGSIFFFGGYSGIQMLNNTKLAVIADLSTCINAIAMYSNVEYDGTLYAICDMKVTRTIVTFNIFTQVFSTMPLNLTSCRPSQIVGAGGAVFINCLASTTSIYAISNNTARALVNATQCTHPYGLFAFSGPTVYALCVLGSNSIISVDIDPSTQSVKSITPIASQRLMYGPQTLTRDAAGNIFVTDNHAIYQILAADSRRLLYTFPSYASSVDQLFSDPVSALLYVYRMYGPLISLNLSTTPITSTLIVSAEAIGKSTSAFLVKPNRQVFITTTYGVLRVDGSGISSYPSTIRNCTVVAAVAFDGASNRVSAMCREKTTLVSIGKIDSRVFPSLIDAPCSTLGSAYRDPLTNVTYFSCINGSSALAFLSPDGSQLTRIDGPANCMPALGVYYSNGYLFFTCSGGAGSVFVLPLASNSTTSFAMVAKLNQCYSATSVMFDATTEQLFITCSGSMNVGNIKSVTGIVRAPVTKSGECEASSGVRFLYLPSGPALLAMCPTTALVSVSLVDETITTLVDASLCTGSVTRGVATPNGNMIAIVCGYGRIILASMGSNPPQQIIDVGSCLNPIDGVISADGSLITFPCGSSAATPLMRLYTVTNTFTNINLTIVCSYPRTLVQGETELVFYLLCDQGLIKHDITTNHSTLLAQENQDQCAGMMRVALLHGVLYASCFNTNTVMALDLNTLIATYFLVSQLYCQLPTSVLAAPSISQLFVTCASNGGSGAAIVGIDVASSSMYAVASQGSCSSPVQLDYNPVTHSLVAACNDGIMTMSLGFQCSEGSYWAVSGECAECPINTYRNVSHISPFGLCLDCPAGTIASAIGSTICAECDIGTYESNRKCVFCAAGAYQNMTGQTSCLECEIGRYSATPGSTICSECEAGSASNTTGSLVCNLCLPGQFQVNKRATACNPCDSGRYSLSSASTVCLECNAGFYSVQKGTVNCLACTPGRSSNTTARTTVCDICQPGTYQNGIGKTSCFTCEAQSYSEKPEATSCTRCDSQVNPQRTACNSSMCDKNTQYNSITSNCDLCALGQYSAIGGLCTDCSLNTYTPFAGSDCISCQLPGMGGLSCTSGLASVNQGYWSYLSLVQPDSINGLTSASFLYQTVECPVGYCPSHVLQVRQATNSGSNANDSFANATVAGIMYCDYPRLNDPSNSLCAACVEGYLPWNGQCVHCEGTNGPILFAGVIVSFLLVIFLLQSSGSAAGTVSIFLFFIQTCALEIGPNSRFLDWIQILNLDAKSTNACLAQWTPYQQTLFSLFMPIILLAELASIAFLHFSLYKYMGSESEAAPPANSHDSTSRKTQLSSYLLRTIRGFSIDTYIAASMSVILFCYTQVSTASFSYLFCVQVADHRLLFSAPTVDCDAPEYKAYLVPVIITIVGYVVAFPIAIIALLWTHSESLFLPADDANRLRGSVSSFLVRYAPLYLMFQPHAWWWQPLILLRRAAFVLVSVVLAQQPALRFLLYNVFHFLCFLLHIVIHPFRSRSLNIMESISYSLLILLSALLTGCMPPYQLSVQILVFLLIVPAAILMFLYIIYDRWTSKTKQKSLNEIDDETMNGNGRSTPKTDHLATSSASAQEVELSAFTENPLTPFTSTAAAATAGSDDRLRRPLEPMASQAESIEEINNFHGETDMNARIIEFSHATSDQAAL